MVAKSYVFAEGLVTVLTPSHAQSVWGFRQKMIQATGLAAYYNYFSKKKSYVSVWENTIRPSWYIKVGNWGRLVQFWFIWGCLLNTTANVWKGHQRKRMKRKMKVPSCCWQAGNWCQMLEIWIYLAISKIGLDKWVWTKNFINGPQFKL